MKAGTFSRGWQCKIQRALALTTLLFLLAHVAQFSGARVAYAQEVVARVAVVQRIVEKRSSGTPFRKANVGATLVVNDALRTGKRSKVDMKFAITLGADHLH
jgi:hypothetical protein